MPSLSHDFDPNRFAAIDARLGAPRAPSRRFVLPFGVCLRPPSSIVQTMAPASPIVRVAVRKLLVECARPVAVRGVPVVL